MKEVFNQLMADEIEPVEYFENPVLTRDGEERLIAWHNSVLRDDHGEITEALSSGEDITERKRAEEALHRIEWLLTKTPEKHRYTPPYGDLTVLNTTRGILGAVGHTMLHDIANDYLALLGTSSAVYEKDGSYALGIFASGWCQFLDQASRRVCQTDDNAEALHSGRWLCHESCWTESSKTAIESGKPVDIECHGGIRLYAVPIFVGSEVIGAINFGYGDPPRDPQKLQKIAEQYHVGVEELTRQAYAYESHPSFIIELAKDRLATSATLIGEITNRKQMEDQLRTGLKERTALLQEIHHRVKNNLQAVSSLLYLQADKTENVETRKSLEESRERILAMAMIHEQLYASESLAEINMAEYIEKLVIHLYHSYEVDIEQIALRLTLEPLVLSIEQAVPCGLLIQELVSNAFKHAFPEGRKGELGISFQVVDDTVKLVVSNTGIPFPGDLDPCKATTMGLELVNTFTRQLQGKIDCDRNEGTTFSITFPKKTYE